MISIVHWPWRVGLNPKAACLSSILSMSVLLPSPFWKTFSGEEMWSLHHSAICPYGTLSSSCFRSSKKPSNNKWLSISCLTRSSCRQRQGMRNLAQGTAFPKRPNNKHADPHRAEWHIFLILWRSVRGVVRIRLHIWNSLCTACSKSATGKHTGLLQGFHLAHLLRDK